MASDLKEGLSAASSAMLAVVHQLEERLKAVERREHDLDVRAAQLEVRLALT